MSVPSQPPDAAFAKGLREAISIRGLSLERLRAHLAQRGHPVSIATLSYWQTARSRPDRAASLAALESLEEILGLEPGALASLLPLKRRRTAAAFVPTADPAHGSVRYGERLDEAVAQLGLGWADGLRRISVHDILVLDDRGFSRVMMAREVVVAEEATVTRFPIWALRDDTSMSYRIEGRHNCTVTNIINVDDEPVAVVELTLSRPLPPGQALVLEYQMDVSGGQAPMTEHLRSCRHPVREVHMEVRFGAGPLPRSAEQFTLAGDQRRAAPLLVKGPNLALRHSDFGPGVVGIAWVW